jgi:hypothetical protein
LHRKDFEKAELEFEQRHFERLLLPPVIMRSYHRAVARASKSQVSLDKLAAQDPQPGGGAVSVEPTARDTERARTAHRTAADLAEWRFNHRMSPTVTLCLCAGFF